MVWMGDQAPWVFEERLFTWMSLLLNLDMNLGAVRCDFAGCPGSSPEDG